MKMKELFINRAIKEAETKLLDIYSISHCEKKYKIYMFKKLTNRRTVIHCEGDSLYYEQKPLFWHLAGKRYGEKIAFFKAEKEKNVETIVVIKGMPDGIVGIDDGVFASYKKYNPRKINVMIKKHFYRLEV
ncbi:MAG: hypothetical protein IJ946_07450 [Clostridia bacterium]|nr:hypothetical protein [Clostridia bacterium]